MRIRVVETHSLASNGAKLITARLQKLADTAGLFSVGAMSAVHLQLGTTPSGLEQSLDNVACTCTTANGRRDTLHLNTIHNNTTRADTSANAYHLTTNTQARALASVRVTLFLRTATTCGTDMAGQAHAAHRY